MPVAGSKPWHNTPKLHTLSVMHPLCGSTHADTMDTPSDKCRNKLTDLHSYPKEMPLFYDQSCTILQLPHIPPMTVTCCQDSEVNLKPLDESAGTVTTHPIRLAYPAIASYVAACLHDWLYAKILLLLHSTRRPSHVHTAVAPCSRSIVDHSLDMIPGMSRTISILWL